MDRGKVLRLSKGSVGQPATLEPRTAEEHIHLWWKGREPQRDRRRDQALWEGAAGLQVS